MAVFDEERIAHIIEELESVGFTVGLPLESTVVQTCMIVVSENYPCLVDLNQELPGGYVYVKVGFFDEDYDWLDMPSEFEAYDINGNVRHYSIMGEYEFAQYAETLNLRRKADSRPVYMLCD